MKKTVKMLISALLILNVALFLISCGTNDEGTYSANLERVSFTDADDSFQQDGVVAENDAASVSQRPDSNSISGDKIIYRQTLSMETENLQETISKMEQDLDRYGGHIHRYQVLSEKEASPRGTFTLRVPSESLKDFVNSIREYGIFTQEILESDDVSETHYDLEANLRNQTIQERRLLDLLEEAENLTDTLTLESELSRIRREIERLNGQIYRLDDQVQYSTIYLSMQQVENGEITEESFSDQFFRNLRASFGKFQEVLESALLWLASYFPFLLLAGILLGIISKLHPRFSKKLKGKEPLKTQE